MIFSKAAGLGLAFLIPDDLFASERSAAPGCQSLAAVSGFPLSLFPSRFSPAWS
jgi:hypothetical protein